MAGLTPLQKFAEKVDQKIGEALDGTYGNPRPTQAECALILSARAAALTDGTWEPEEF